MGRFEKRFRTTVLEHGLEENKLLPWENRDDTLKIFEDFMKDGLLFDELELDFIQIADIHRLHQKPLFEKGKRINVHIIVKLTTMSNKRSVFSRA